MRHLFLDPEEFIGVFLILDFFYFDLYSIFCFRKLEKQKEKKRKEEQKRKIASLSFNPEEGEEEDEEMNEEDEDCKLFKISEVFT